MKQTSDNASSREVIVGAIVEGSSEPLEPGSARATLRSVERQEVPLDPARKVTER